MSDFTRNFDAYLDALAFRDYPLKMILVSAEESDVRKRLEPLSSLAIPDALVEFFCRIDDFDDDQAEEHEIDMYSYHLAWGMEPLTVTESIRDYDSIAGIGGSEEPNYWPHGFVPILSDGAGSWIVVNCIDGSPTFGAVYEMTDCVGVNRLADTLAVFFDAARRELEIGLRTCQDGMLLASGQDYFARAAHVYGPVPYFQRADASDQIIDWL